MNVDARTSTPTARAAIPRLHFPPARARGRAPDGNVFADDLAFTADESLARRRLVPADPGGRRAVLARGIDAGPDEAFERVRWAILGAMSRPASELGIVYPLLPPGSRADRRCSHVAALRGVPVDIVNSRAQRPAARALGDRSAKSGRSSIRVAASGRSPTVRSFEADDVDGVWTPSAQRTGTRGSLRLNFEFNVECYDMTSASEFDELIDDKIGLSRPLTLADVHARNLPIKLRDGAAWLLSPYL